MNWILSRGVYRLTCEIRLKVTSFFWGQRVKTLSYWQNVSMVVSDCNDYGYDYDSVHRRTLLRHRRVDCRFSCFKTARNTEQMHAGSFCCGIKKWRQVHPNSLLWIRWPQNDWNIPERKKGRYRGVTWPVLEGVSLRLFMAERKCSCREWNWRRRGGEEEVWRFYRCNMSLISDSLQPEGDDQHRNLSNL